MSCPSLPNSIIFKILSDLREEVANDHKKKFQASLTLITVSDEDWESMEYAFGEECWNDNNSLDNQDLQYQLNHTDGVSSQDFQNGDFAETCIATYVVGLIYGDC
tara:strand:- start:56 stop:370 length:315 start_codon:yes stop_codon:yes gene_type:complete